MNNENVNKTEEKEEVKSINPLTDKGNYLIQVLVDGKPIKEVIALNSNVNIIHVGNQSLATDIK